MKSHNEDAFTRWYVDHALSEASSNRCLLFVTVSCGCWGIIDHQLSSPAWLSLVMIIAIVIVSPLACRVRAGSLTMGSPRMSRTTALTAIAASLLFGVALTVGIVRHYATSERVIVTGAGQSTQRTLPDNSRIRVNSDSSVEIDYTDETRLVRIDKGSAEFDVMKDATRPFIARTPLVDVTAVGTRFEVHIDRGVTTTVSEGTVRVTRRGHGDAQMGRLLRAGEKLQIWGGSPMPAQAVSADVDEVLQEANGFLTLEGATVAEIAAQLNRHNHMQLVVESPTLAAGVFDVGQVRLDSPESFARMVVAGGKGHMTVDRENDVIRLTE